MHSLLMVLMGREGTGEGLPCSPSTVPPANYLLMSSLSRIDLLHHHNYHHADEH